MHAFISLCSARKLGSGESDTVHVKVMRQESSLCIDEGGVVHAVRPKFDCARAHRFEKNGGLDRLGERKFRLCRYTAHNGDAMSAARGRCVPELDETDREKEEFKVGSSRSRESVSDG